MYYLKVLWSHDFSDEPVVLYSEVDNEGYETRKVEIYRDGRHDYANAIRSTGTTQLSEKPMPSIKEIAAHAEFSPMAVDLAEFENVYRHATEGI